MARWNTYGALPWISLILCVGFILHVVGFATNEWMIRSVKGSPAKSENGLWRICATFANSSSDCGTLDIDDVPDWWQGSQALETIGLVTYLMAAVTCILTMRQPRRARDDYRWNLRLATVVFLVITVCMIAIGVIIFWVEFKDDFPTNAIYDVDIGYSGILCLVSAIIGLICCFIVCGFVTDLPPPRWFTYGFGGYDDDYYPRGRGRYDDYDRSYDRSYGRPYDRSYGRSYDRSGYPPYGVPDPYLHGGGVYPY